MKTLKRRSQNQEKSVAKNMNAKTVVASGAKWKMNFLKKLSNRV